MVATQLARVQCVQSKIMFVFVVVVFLIAITYFFSLIGRGTSFIFSQRIPCILLCCQLFLIHQCIHNVSYVFTNDFILQQLNSFL